MPDARQRTEAQGWREHGTTAGAWLQLGANVPGPGRHEPHGSEAATATDEELLTWLRTAGLVGNGAAGVTLTELGQRAVRLLTSLQQTPIYDGTALWWRGVVVKRLRKGAANQRAVLAAFQAAGWPPHIDDPLGDKAGLLPEERLRETVKSLNLHLAAGTICFCMDGTGRGVCWEKVAE